MNVTVMGINAPEIKLARELVTGKKTDNENIFICEGLWAVKKIVERDIKTHLFLYCPELIKSEVDRADVNIMLKHCKNSFQISEKACKKISDRDGADSAFIICEMPVYKLSDLPIKDDMLIMVLDGQEQPGNIGAIIRSLDAAGGDFAIMTNKRVRHTHSRLIRSSLGAAFMMPFLVAEMNDIKNWLIDNNFKIIVTDLTATKSYYDVDYSGRIAIVAGNEYTGINPSWRDLKGALPVIIPMLGSVESLNVGFASTLVAYEARRYKTFAK